MRKLRVMVKEERLILSKTLIFKKNKGAALMTAPSDQYPKISSSVTVFTGPRPFRYFMSRSLMSPRIPYV